MKTLSIAIIVTWRLYVNYQTIIRPIRSDKQLSYFDIIGRVAGALLFEVLLFTVLHYY